MTTSNPPVPVSNDQNPHVPMRPEWLALHTEEVIEPALPIIDPHHHLWDFPEAGKNFRYRAADLLADIGSQNIAPLCLSSAIHITGRTNPTRSNASVKWSSC
jgi:hypothetical protein